MYTHTHALSQLTDRDLRVAFSRRRFIDEIDDKPITNDGAPHADMQGSPVACVRGGVSGVRCAVCEGEQVTCYSNIRRNTGHDLSLSLLVSLSSLVSIYCLYLLYFLFSLLFVLFPHQSR